MIIAESCRTFCYYFCMEIIEINSKSADIRKIRKLYNTSFPDDERIPFSHLLRTVGSERIMHAYYDNSVLTGLTVVFLMDDIVYLSYICISEEMRNRGYGTEILQAVKNEYPGCRMVVDIEELKRESSNYEERLRRREFYLRNGFVSCSVFYHFYYVDYELLSCNGTVSQQEWAALVRKHWGRYAETAIYR